MATVTDCDTSAISVLSQRQAGVRLSEIERRALQYLDSHAGRYVPAGELVDYVWGGGATEDAVRKLVSRLRQRFGYSTIEGGRGFGYRLSHGRAAELDHVCGQCRRLMVEYPDVSQCYGCGAQVQYPAPLEGAGELTETRQKQGGSRGGRPWTDEEVAYVMEHLGDMTHEELGAQLERSEAAVRGLLQNMGVRKPYVRAKR